MAIYDEGNLPEGVTLRDVQRLEQADRLSKLYAARRDQIADRLKASMPVGTHRVGDVGVKISVASVLDSKAATSALPVSEFPGYYKYVLNTAALPDEIKAKHSAEQVRLSVSRFN